MARQKLEPTTGIRAERVKPPAWLERLEELKAFKSLFGHCNVPRQYPANGPLASWLRRLRPLKRQGKLDKELACRLDELGFDWEPPSGARYGRKAMMAALVAFKKEHGHCNVPSADRPLGTWVVRLRRLKKQGKLDKETIRQLDALGFCWERRRRTVQRHDWDAMLAALADFKRRHGHGDVSPSDDPDLASWLAGVRRKRIKGSLEARRIRELDRLGITWEPAKERWEANYAALLDFKKEYGHTNVPLSWPKNPRLARWANRLRWLRRQDKLPSSQIERLDAIGFAWDRTFFKWDERFAELAEFQKQNGHCRVPVTTGLGHWVRFMRTRRKQGKLTQQQIEQLDRLGFVWRCY